MKTKTLAILLLMLLVISSLEAASAGADEVTNINELYELNALGMDQDGVGKHKHLCREECDHPAMGRCLKSECIQACKETGYITGKCKKSASYNVKKCYCYKDCKIDDHPPHLLAPPHKGPPIKGRSAKGRSADYPPVKGPLADYHPVEGPLVDYPPVESPPADSPPEKHRLIKRRRRPSKGHPPAERVPAGGHPPIKGVPSGGVPVIGLPVPVGVLPVPVGVLPVPIGVLPVIPIGGSHAKGSPSTKNPPSKGADIEVPVKGRPFDDDPCIGTACRKCSWIRNLISMRKRKSCFRN